MSSIMRECRLIVDTNKYAGNFERELAVFLFNGQTEVAKDEILQYDPQPENLEKMRWAWDRDTGDGILIQQQGEDTGFYEFQSICSTPLYTQDESGKWHKATGKTGWMNTQSVMFEFSRSLTDEEIQLVTDRLQGFSQAMGDYQTYATGIEILGVRVVEREMIVTESERFFEVA